ncbi:MAG: BrnA antitoxin family protein [Betaproteobacteria bacterium]|nr:BrnA antitoxin family protein [Betaproteobacteria bacterium]
MHLAMLTLMELTIMMLEPRTTARPTLLRSCSGKKKAPPTEHVAFPLDSDVLDALHAMGEDWETHFNTILREWLRSNPVVSVA